MNGHRENLSLFGGVRPGEPDPDGRKAWEAFYPACQHVFLTRRNKLRLAVSWWRAIQSDEWHRPNRDQTVVGQAPGGPVAAEVIDRYDPVALHQLLIGANVREAAMQDQFDTWGVVPHTIVYEDFIASYESTVRDLLDFLHVPGRQGIPIPAAVVRAPGRRGLGGLVSPLHPGRRATKRVGSMPPEAPAAVRRLLTFAADGPQLPDRGRSPEPRTAGAYTASTVGKRIASTGVGEHDHARSPRRRRCDSPWRR